MGYYATGLLPREVVRDLLGIARALYATRKAEAAAPEELAKLAGAGALLVDALDLSRTEPDTVGHRAAWAKAERATAAVLDVLVIRDPSLSSLVAEWGARLKART
jgi:hypothetical protein